MSTVSAVILKHQKKVDGTYNVKIRISHNKSDAYIETKHFVGGRQLNKTFKIKDQFILDIMHPQLKEYRDKISLMGEDLSGMSARQLKEHITAVNDTGDVINFLKFGTGLVRQKRNEGKDSSAKTLLGVVLSLQDYLKSDFLNIKDLNANFLYAYERYLRSNRKFSRPSSTATSGKAYHDRGPMSDAGVHHHMRDLRIIFNEARNFYNDEDSGVIKIIHYPFRKYKIGAAPLTRHRNRTVDELKIIRDAVVPTGGRTEIARDLFMLSFYLNGMNAIDIYHMSTYSERYGYNRMKTKDKRRDKAYISIKIIDPARVILEKWLKPIQSRFATIGTLTNAISAGMQNLSEVTGIPGLQFYDARHSVGTLARNTCGFSTEDVARALNQKDWTVTDIYIAPDWSAVDRVQDAVVSLIAGQPIDLAV